MEALAGQWVATMAAETSADKVASDLSNMYLFDNSEVLAAVQQQQNHEQNGWTGVPAVQSAPNSSPPSPQQPHPSSASPHGLPPHRMNSMGQETSIGWGGQTIQDSPGFRVPWFGRSRGKGGPPRGRGRGRMGGYNDNRGRRAVRRSWSTNNAAEHGLDVDDGMSVEDVVHCIQGLPKGQHIPESCYQALFHFDSRAAALLLKDLSKAGLGFRAIELFDWLRKLEEGHPLHGLCDVYTYTAMISLCIYQQVPNAPVLPVLLAVVLKRNNPFLVSVSAALVGLSQAFACLLTLE